MRSQSHGPCQSSKMSSYFVLFSFCLILILKHAETITSVREYCENFPENLRPILCILQDNDLVPKSTTSTRRPPWGSKGHGWGWHRPTTGAPTGGGWGWEDSSSEEDEQTCTCSLTCYPPPAAIDCDTTVNVEYNCVNTCGSNCDVTTSITPRCDCSTVGVGPRTCGCSVNCATNPSRHEDPFCIFNVTGVFGPCNGRPVDCECCKSKASANNRNPEFVCVCQRL